MRIDQGMRAFCDQIRQPAFNLHGHLRSASGQPDAMLINFGSSRLEIKKFVLWLLCFLW